MLDLAPPARTLVDGVDLLCWNLHIGVGRLRDLLAALREGAYGGAGCDPQRPLVILAQEAYRSDATVRGLTSSRFTGGLKHQGTPRNIAEMAQENGLSLRYWPSMRNGIERSDRGNAILANVAIGRSFAWALPYVRQHRVPIAAELVNVPGVLWLSAHLDTWGQPRGRGLGFPTYGAGRVAQARVLARRAKGAAPGGSIVLAGDLNTTLGRWDPVLSALHNEGFAEARRLGSWNHTFHTPVQLHLDHILFRPAGERIRSVQVIRVDERPDDRTEAVWGSDHHPLLARVELG